MTRLVAEARALVREALDALDDLPVELELRDVERCLYGVERRLEEINAVRGLTNGSS